MFALFCLRLAAGLAGALLILSPAQINPRFFRTQFLILIGLATGALLLLPHPVSFWEGVGLGLGIFLAFVGSVIWSIQGFPGGRLVIAGTAASLIGALVAFECRKTVEPSKGEVHLSLQDDKSGNQLLWVLAGDLASAWLLGTATTAMLMGHSYLIAPAMSLTPLMRLLAATTSAVLLGMVLAGIGLTCWTAAHGTVNLRDVAVYWLPLRWAMSFAGPLVTLWMAWQSARIRSTQSATGILYVLVIFCFLGELTGQLLLTDTGFCL